jgi:hypothetical protein
MAVSTNQFIQLWPSREVADSFAGDSKNPVRNLIAHPSRVIAACRVATEYASMETAA